MSLLKHNWKLLITICSPLVLSAIPILWETEGGGKEPYGAFVVLLMCIYWMTECIPLSVTSFIPIILYPLFGILSTDRVTTAYLTDAVFFLFGGCILALSFEFSNLHTRLGLRVLLIVGAKVPQLLFGIMITTACLSMFMNNTSCTAMMVPIVHAIIGVLQKEMENSEKPREENIGQIRLESLRGNVSSSTLVKHDATISPMDDSEESEEIPEAKQKRIKAEIRNLRIMFLLGTAWSSNIGGTGVITGSSSNVVALDMIRKEAEDPLTSQACKDVLSVSFLDWMIFNIPPMLINTFLTWLYVQIHFVGCPQALCFWRRRDPIAQHARFRQSESERRIKEAIRAKYSELGSLRAHEIGVLALFSITVLLWVFKDPKIIPGWDSLPIFVQGDHGKSFIKEATPTFLIVLLLCIIPSKTVYYAQAFSGGLSRGLKDPLLSWDFIYRKFPWGLFMLLGGGTGMAIGAKASGLNRWIALQLETSSALKEIPEPVLLLVIFTLVSIVTSIASNTACAAIITPVLLGIAYAKDIHPLFLVLGGASVCSYAFALPVSTPPNAIAYSSTTEIGLKDITIPGLVINVISVLVITMTTLTTSSWFFNFQSYKNECAGMKH